MIGLLAALAVVTVAAAGRAAVAVTRRQVVQRRLDRAVAGAAQASGPAGSLPEPPAWVGRRLDEAGLEIDPALAWWSWVAVSSLVPVATLVLAGVGAAVLTLVLVTTAPALVLRTRRGQGEVRLERGLPAALEAIARSLRSGASLRQAVAEAGASCPGRLGRELTGVARRAEQGVTLVSALESLIAGQAPPGLRLTVAALCLGVETGGAQARAVDGVASTLRDRLAVAGEVRALSSQARMSALVIGLAPVGFGGFAIATDRRTGDFLFRTPLGLALLAVGCGLDGLGWLWMQRLVRVPA